MRKVKWSALLSLVFAVFITAFAAVGCAPAEKPQYSVKFLNFDGTELLSVTLEEGTVPEYTGETPVKTADAQYTYSFKGWDKELAAVTADTEFTAEFNQTVNKYTVTFKNEDGTTLQSTQVAYGSTPEYTGETPEKDDEEDFVYEFKGWDKTLAAVTGAAEYTAEFNKVALFTVTFKNYDGTVLQSGKVKEGEVPSFTGGGTPLKPDDGDFAYTFSGWDKTPVAVTEATEYTAQFSQTALFTITFKNEDGTVLQSGKVKEGEIPKYTGDTPTKAADVQYTYTFDAWDKTVVAVTEATEYTATFGSTLNKYTVTFKNHDGTVLQSSEVEYGTTPEYTGDTPTKTADAQYTYTFDAWDSEIVAVTGAAEYTATFDSTVNTYTIRFMDEDGAVLQTGNVEYGSVPEFTAATPSKEGALGKVYLFNGWNTQPVAVTGAADYTAKYLTLTDLNDWYFEENADFTLPDFATEFGSAEVEYTFGGTAMTAGATLNKAEGNYTYTLATDYDSIDFSIDVLSTADYKENYLKANTSQFAPKDRFAEWNGNNAFYYNQTQGHYEYKVNTNSTYNSRLEFSHELVGGNGKPWTLTDYAYMAVDFCVLNGDIPKNALYNIPKNIKNNANWNFSILFNYGNNVYANSSAMQLNAWYTAYLDLSVAVEADSNDLKFYFFGDEEKGTYAFKNIRFLSEVPQEIEDRVKFRNASNSDLSAVALDETEQNAEYAFKYTKTITSGVDVVWNTKAQIHNTEANIGYNVVQFDMMIASSSLEENGLANAGFQSNSAQPVNSIIDKVTKKAVGASQLAVGKWYTVQLVNSQSAGSDMYIYFTEKVEVEVYFTNAEYLNVDSLALTSVKAGSDGGKSYVTVTRTYLEATYGAANNAYSIAKDKDHGTWGAHTHFDITDTLKAVGKNLSLDIYIYESTKAQDGIANAGFQLNTNITGQKIVDKETGETVTHTQMKLNTWYTVTATLGNDNKFYIYFGQNLGDEKVGVKAYVANAHVSA